MLNPTAGPLRPRALIVDDALARPNTALGRAAESLATALESRNVEVIRAISFEDGRAIVGTDASLGAILLDWNLGSNDRNVARSGNSAAAQAARAACGGAGVPPCGSRAHPRIHDH